MIFFDFSHPPTKAETRVYKVVQCVAHSKRPVNGINLVSWYQRPTVCQVP